MTRNLQGFCVLSNHTNRRRALYSIDMSRLLSTTRAFPREALFWFVWPSVSWSNWKIFEEKTILAIKFALMKQPWGLKYAILVRELRKFSLAVQLQCVFFAKYGARLNFHRQQEFTELLQCTCTIIISYLIFNKLPGLFSLYFPADITSPYRCESCVTIGTMKWMWLHYVGNHWHLQAEWRVRPALAHMSSVWNIDFVLKLSIQTFLFRSVLTRLPLYFTLARWQSFHHALEIKQRQTH